MAGSQVAACPAGECGEKGLGAACPDALFEDSGRNLLLHKTQYACVVPRTE